MKRSWLVIVLISALGVLAGIAIAGRPTTVDDTVITPAPTTTAATSTPTTAATAAATSLPTTSATSAPSTTTSQRIDPSAVRILVANATGTAGIAASTADVLVTAGFTGARAVDAISGLTVTVVYVRAGFEEPAQLVAAQLGLPATVVQPLPETAVTPQDAEADVIVAIGDDFPI